MIYLGSGCALEAVPLAPGARAVCAGAVALGLQTALALRRARQVLGGGDEDAVRLAAPSFARTTKEFRFKLKIRSQLNTLLSSTREERKKDKFDLGWTNVMIHNIRITST